LVAAAAAFSLAAAAVVVAQAPPPAPTGLIAGQVVDADGGRGVGESVVTLTAASATGTPASPAAREARKVITDAAGRFAFTGLEKGRYSVTAVKFGYVRGNHGTLVPRGPGAPIDLEDAERLTDARILVWKHAVITGRVTDEGGEPVVGVEVKAMRRAVVAGNAGFSDAASGTTDDRGIYRLASLEPGSYLVAVPSSSSTIPAAMVEAYFRASGAERAEMQSAIFGVTNSISSPGSPSNQQMGDQILLVGGRSPMPPLAGPDGSMAVYPATYHPQATQPGEATAIALTAGAVRAGVDFTLRPVAAVRVSGRLESAGGPVGLAPVHLVASSSERLAGRVAVASAVADASGAFTLIGVPPGSYTLRVVRLPVAEPRPSPAAVVVQTQSGTASRGVGTNLNVTGEQPTYWAAQAIDVAERDVTDLRVTMHTGYRVSGRIAFEGDASGLPPARVPPFLESADPWLRLPTTETTVAPDGRFSSAEMPSGRYRLGVGAPSGWFVKSVSAGGRELPDLPFELTGHMPDVLVTLSSSGASVAGAVRDAASAPDPTAGVLLFPVDPRQWTEIGSYSRQIKQASVGRSGAYSVADVPAGDYFIAAVPQVLLDWTNPRLLEDLSRLAVRITLRESERRSMDLKVDKGR
jgi:protocatechuate 3,4-dioxygenase beta subunit